MGEVSGYTVRQAARVIGTSQSYVYRLIAQGRIRFSSKQGKDAQGRFRTGGMVLYAEDVDRIAANRK